MLCPTYFSCAFNSSNAGDLGGLMILTVIWNLINYPAGVVPMTKVLNDEHLSYEDKYNDSITKIIKKDLEGSQGMPLTVQIVAKPY